jgi:hypothetical protein
VRRISPLGTDRWRSALVGGLLALPFTALAAWRSPERVALGMVVVGSVLGGYLVKRRGGDSTATGLLAAIVGGFPVLWLLNELLRAIPTVPNPPVFRAVGIALVLALGVLLVGVLALVGALGGRFGGWLAKRRGHGESADPRGG